MKFPYVTVHGYRRYKSQIYSLDNHKIYFIKNIDDYPTECAGYWMLKPDKNQYIIVRVLVDI